MIYDTLTRTSPCFTVKRGRVIGQLLGHRQPATALKYVHFADANARAAVESVAGILAGEA